MFHKANSVLNTNVLNRRANASRLNDDSEKSAEYVRRESTPSRARQSYYTQNNSSLRGVLFAELKGLKWAALINDPTHPLRRNPSRGPGRNLKPRRCIPTSRFSTTSCFLDKTYRSIYCRLSARLLFYKQLATKTRFIITCCLIAALIVLVTSVSTQYNAKFD